MKAIMINSRTQEVQQIEIQPSVTDIKRLQEYGLIDMVLPERRLVVVFDIDYTEGTRYTYIGIRTNRSGVLIGYLPQNQKIQDIPYTVGEIQRNIEWEE